MSCLLCVCGHSVYQCVWLYVWWVGMLKRKESNWVRVSAARCCAGDVRWIYQSMDTSTLHNIDRISVKKNLRATMTYNTMIILKLEGKNNLSLPLSDCLLLPNWSTTSSSHRPSPSVNISWTHRYEPTWCSRQSKEVLNAQLTKSDTSVHFCTSLMIYSCDRVAFRNFRFGITIRRSTKFKAF